MTHRLAQELEQQLLPECPGKLGVAVSGGSDSMALLHLLHDFALAHNVKIFCVTVDHGLRPESRGEAEAVKARCVSLGVPHDILTWSGWDGQGNTQNAARDARYRLIAGWAEGHGISHVALGHTRDDQAETVLMRMARGSGVDGLSGMAVRHQRHGVIWLRPLLGVSRQSLRAFLSKREIDWIEDPTNEDPGYDRIKTRRALEVLSGLGIDAEVLARIALNMAQAREALARQTYAAAKDLVQIKAGGLSFDWSGLLAQPTEIRRRLLLNAIRWVSGAVYPPRRRALAAAMDAVQADGSTTLGGCLLLLHDQRLWVFRELNAVEENRVPVGALWDGRWRCAGQQTMDFEVAPLGPDGLAQCDDWRATGLPRPLLMSTPAVWNGSTLVAAPLVNACAAWQVVLERGEDAFFAAVLSH